MATRCTVKVEGVDFAKLYIHWDGDPESKMPFLEHFNTQFTKARGDDSSYKFAQLLRATALLQDDFNLDASTTTGYGIIPFTAESWEDYEYTLHIDGSTTYKES